MRLSLRLCGFAQLEICECDYNAVLFSAVLNVAYPSADKKKSTLENDEFGSVEVGGVKSDFSMVPPSL